MGVDLILIPFGNENQTAISYTALEVDRDSTMWPQIRALESKAVPERFQTPFGRSYPEDPDFWDRDTSVDSYGKPVRWVFAKDLTAFRKHQDFPLNISTGPFGPTWNSCRRQRGSPCSGIEL